MKLNKLKAKIVEMDMNVATLAELIEMDRATLYRKLNDAERFTVGDVRKMKKALQMTNEEACDIFLD